VRIAGIDPDTHQITCALIDTVLERTGEIRTVEAKGRRAEDRFFDLMHQFEERIAPILLSYCWVYVELPMAGPNRKATINQSQVVGAIRAILGQRAIGHSLVDPGVWKKAVLGNGHASKDEIKAWVLAHYTLDPNLPQDAFDATAIAHFGVKGGGELP